VKDAMAGEIKKNSVLSPNIHKKGKFVYIAFKKSRNPEGNVGKKQIVLLFVPHVLTSKNSYSSSFPADTKIHKKVTLL